MSYSTLLTSLENNILTITVNRPDKLNALNNDVFTDLEKVVDEIQNDAAIRSAYHHRVRAKSICGRS
jgi:enoyl-CoA hydratase